ncbi:helix-turn-helix domain-containing protein [Streptomyces sp. NPDC060027]|uniref:helix-turn-helix domain-containing protein n=1 Tax=Streptomyces sp. NPDC060027 TaxID=3347040 RepID=UPI003686CC51
MAHHRGEQVAEPSGAGHGQLAQAQPAEHLVPHEVVGETVGAPGVWSGQPVSLELEDLDVICVVLGCEIGDLLIPDSENVRRPGQQAGVQEATTGSMVVPRFAGASARTGGRGYRGLYCRRRPGCARPEPTRPAARYGRPAGRATGAGCIAPCAARARARLPGRGYNKHPRRPRRHPLHFTFDVLQAVLATVQQTVFGLRYARRAVVAQAGVGEGFDRVGTGCEGGMILFSPVRLATPRLPDRR